MEFGGYLCSGSVYFEQICIGTECSYRMIYAAEIVTQNAWLYNQNGAFGILGYGPNSAFWNQYIDTEGVATFSIELASVPQNSLQANQAVLATSNVTFGSAGNQVDYLNNPSLVVSTSGSQSVSFNLTQLGFGAVYQTGGVDSSSYFANLTNPNAVQFNTAFKGLGLPTSLY